MEQKRGKRLTTAFGTPVEDDQNSMTAGQPGPVLMQDTHLLEKLAHFDRERIPERVVHAKGAGAYGYFEVTEDVTPYTRARFLSKVGKRTPLFLRFSTVGGEKGSPDAARDPRGLAVKFYTEEGNYDLVGNNTPVFFIRDPLKCPDFIHTQKRNPRTNLQDPDMFWDFLSLTPESVHQVTVLFSDRGTPASYRHMNGYSSHTFKWCNEKGEYFWVQYHFKTDQGIRNLSRQEATRLSGQDPDHATRDLFQAIDRGEYPSWTLEVQILTPEQGRDFRWDIFDITKVWPHAEVPPIRIGKMVLDRNPVNYFAEVEQAAFSRQRGSRNRPISGQDAAGARLLLSRHSPAPAGSQLPLDSRQRSQSLPLRQATNGTASCASTTTGGSAPTTGLIVSEGSRDERAGTGRGGGSPSVHASQ